MAQIDPILLNDWHVVATVQSLQPGTIQSVRVLGEDLVLWRTGETFLAWDDYCPHRGARLSLGQVAGDTLVCPYHGLAYDVTGKCVHIPAHPQQSPPAKARVQVYSCQERYGLVWVCLGDADATDNLSVKRTHQSSPTPVRKPVADFPEWNDATYRKFLCGPYRYRSSGLRAIENFLDVSHFPFVHQGLLGDRNYTSIDDYEVELSSDGITIRDLRIWQPNPDGVGAGGLVTYNYRVWRPLTASLSKQSAGGQLAIFFTVTPVDEEECLGWMLMAMNYGHEIPEEDLRTFQNKIVEPDITIVESQRPKRLPLYLRNQDVRTDNIAHLRTKTLTTNLEAFHLPCDRASFTYRRWLKQLGVTFGAM